MSAYKDLAGSYDALTRDVDYEAYADFCIRQFDRLGVTVRSVLDLACGTGTLSLLFAEKGYDVTGVDASEDMLSEAIGKSFALPADKRPLFVQQDLRQIDLYGSSDAVLCSLDGMNYLPQEDVGQVLRRLYNFTEPGGLILFDINTPAKLRSMDGQMYIDETEDAFCVWRAETDDRRCEICYDLFTRRKALWQRSREEHTEYLHEPETLLRHLTDAGFTDLGTLDGREAGFTEAPGMRLFLYGRRAF